MASSIIKSEILLKLNNEEAKLIKSLMQNATGNETAEEAQLRKEIFSALPPFHELQ